MYNIWEGKVSIVDAAQSYKGRVPKKKNVYFRALPESGGGEAPARIFWPFFHKVIGPKISLFLLKSHNICVFIGHFYHQFHQYYHHHHHNHNFNHHHHHLYFFLSYAQYVVFDVRKKRTKLPEWGGGGRGRTNLGNARK